MWERTMVSVMSLAWNIHAPAIHHCLTNHLSGIQDRLSMGFYILMIVLIAGSIGYLAKNFQAWKVKVQPQNKLSKD